MNRLLKQTLLICACLFALTGQAIASSLSDAMGAYEVGDYAKAARLLRPLAEQGDAFAQMQLGVMYDYGKGVPENYKEALKWIRLAAEQGEPYAQEYLDAMLVGKGFKEALKYLRLEAERGNPYAQEGLMMHYMNGMGIPKNSVLVFNCIS